MPGTRAARAKAVAVATLVVLASSCSEGGPSPEDGVGGGSSQIGTSFVFAAIGDFGFRNENEDLVAEAVHEWVDEHDADALVTAGDNIYPNGKTKFFDEAWRQPYGWVEKRDLRVVASLGNHDLVAGNGVAVMELLDMPAPWYQASLADADLFVLDSMSADDPEQQRWLETALERSDAAWQIAVLHHPAYSCSNHGGSPDVLDSFVPRLEDGGVDLVISGHDHNYQRFAVYNGVTYVVAGGGGANLYDVTSCEREPAPDLEASDDESHHFLTVRGNELDLVVEALSPDGRTLDRFKLSR